MSKAGNRARVCGAAIAAIAGLVSVTLRAQVAPPAADVARARGVAFERAVSASHRLLDAWLQAADPKTLLLPDRLEDPKVRIYNPHNSGADLYPYLILTAQLTDPARYRGRLMEMLRNEVRYTTAYRSIPGSLDLTTGVLSGPSLFGAGEYAKDGLIAVTEYLGRGPWFSRMVDLIADAMDYASVQSQFGALPARDAELNGDYLQALVRLYTMTGEPRFLEWARRIGDAYVQEVLPGSFGVPAMTWDFEKHTGERRLRLRDHGNETVVGLVMLFTLEHELKTPRAAEYRPVLARMLDRILASANEDGMLYNEVDPETLAPRDKGLSDNWGYVYGAVYAFHQATGEAKYQQAVRRVLGNLPKYRKHVWEPRRGLPLGSFDGYADAIESAIYLVNREPLEVALEWIDSEMAVMLDMQRPDGRVEDWYGEGNFNRTALLYAYMKSQGVRPEAWEPGVRVGAARDGDRLVVDIVAPAPRRFQFDTVRHRRVLNFAKNYVRLNEFPEWFTVDDNRLYRVTRQGTSATSATSQGVTSGGFVPPSETRLGSELAAGVELSTGTWIVEPIPGPPYGEQKLLP